MLPSYLTLTLNEETGECVSWDLRIDKYNGVTYISIMSNSKAPCKGKSFVNCLVLKLLPLQGDRGKCCLYPGCCPGLGASALSGRMALTCESSVRLPFRNIRKR